jgi:hypothetical protein
MGRKEFYNALGGQYGAQRQAEAKAQIATGLMFTTAATLLVGMEVVTPSGPANREMRRAATDAGYNFGSIRVPQEDGSVKHIPIVRFGPIADYLTIMADAAEVAPFLGEGDWERASAQLLTGFSMNLRNRTYLSGIAEFMDVAFSGDPAKWERYMARQAGTMVPNAFAQAKDDDLMREMRSFVDGLRARVQGYSENSDPVRNLFGQLQVRPPMWSEEFISPVFVSQSEAGQQPYTQEWLENVNTEPKNELARLMHVTNSTIQNPPTKKDEVDLLNFRAVGQQYSAYDRLVQLAGLEVINGKTMYEAIGDLIQSSTYQNVLTDGGWDERGSRLDAIGSVVGAYRSKAWATLLKEDYIDPQGRPLEDVWRASRIGIVNRKRQQPQ